VAERESQIVLGLDPDPLKLWPEADDAAAGALGAPPVARAAAGVLAHCCAVIDAVGDAVVAVKPQVACFERLGAPGWTALAATVAHARAAGLLVLADGKRGDIDVTATAYAQGFLGAGGDGIIAGLGADALTVNPYMGLDTLRSFAAVGRAHEAGLFVLVRTSNPGAADLEDEPLARGGTVWERVAELVAELGAEHRAPLSGLSDIGAVLGATRPEHLARARELLPHAIFLLPGVGAQGGRVEDLAPAFAPGRAAGLVTASRSIVGAHEQDGDAASPADAARAEAERLRAAAWALD
jgi:orotidine-5'-phosphate decarboxylase